MKAFLVLDELNQFHWAMLKSVLLILALLPIAEVSLKLWLSTEGSSQIMIGFFALSIVRLVNGELLYRIKNECMAN